MKPVKAIYVLIIVIIVAAGAFYGGMLYQKSQRSSFAGGAGGFTSHRFGGAGGGQGGFAGGAGGAQSMMPVRGQIVSTANGSITVKMQDGSSKIVNLTGQTKVSQTTTGSVSDLKTGTTVTAIGTANSDGSVTAQDVMIGGGNVMFRTGGRGPQSGPTGSQ
jgi:hypothetical protein